MVTDNLNIHGEKSLKETLGEENAQKLLKKIEWHYTPKHASWLDQVEIEINALSRQALKEFIPTFQAMQKQCAVWQKDRNTKQIGINWQFTREKAINKFQILERNTHEN